MSFLVINAESAEKKWWQEQFGEPKYGGKLTIVWTKLGDQFDPYMPFATCWYEYEQLFMADFTQDRNEWNFKVTGNPPKYAGLLAESWEWNDPQTLVINLRQNVKWQNKPPTNGREFTADDVVYHYNRVLGMGEFAKPNPFTSSFIEPVKSVEARDKYTVVVHFKEPTPLPNWWAITDASAANMMEPREQIALNNPRDWHNAAGTGAFIISDFISGNSITLSKNPDYYRHDDRYPDKLLPYVDTLKFLCILEPSTQLAALRSGKADLLFEMDWQRAENLRKSNPELMITSRPNMGMGLDMRVDKKPFNDIHVRKAMQLAIDIPTIAANHYGGSVSSDPPGIISTEYKGWALPYEEWPEDLQKEYSYNPDGARKLLAEAGYPKGFKTNCFVSTRTDLDLIQIMKSYFMDIGVDMTINTMEENQLTPFLMAGKHDQMYAGGFFNQTWPVNISFFNRTSMQKQNHIYAPAEEVEPYEKLYSQFMRAPDEATAKQLIRQAQEYSLRMHWGIITTEQRFFDAARPRVKGFAGEDMTGFNLTWFWTRLWVNDN